MKTDSQKNNSIQRPPVVVVLGHVDHGKSSLLEAIRDFKITAREAGGITQHIGAYEVEHSDKSGKIKKITFIDTPGHEAFSAMRLRGAEVADIALLVVDAAQSVQQQTREAILAIKKSGIPMIVTLNKIDLPSADPEKIKRELAKIDILVESMGGTVPAVQASAKEKRGIDELLEMILLVAELQDLKAQTDVPAEGLVIESYVDSLKGPIATLLLEKGVLKEKDIIATDSTMAKIKSLKNFQQKPITKTYPSQPVIALGFQTAPGLGERFKKYATAEEAEEKIKREKQKRKIEAVVLDTGTDKKFFNIILKTDVLGSREAIEGMLKNLPQDKVLLRILKSEVGDINESDASLASAARAQVIGFRTKIIPSVAQWLKKETKKTVRIKTFEIIYELIQDVRSAMEKSMGKELVHVQLGKIKASVIFWAEKNRQIVGGKITEGEIKKGLKLEVFRNEELIGQGRIINLQRNKKDVEKLAKGDECGILFEGNVKVEKGDIISAYIEEMK